MNFRLELAHKFGQSIPQFPRRWAQLLRFPDSNPKRVSLFLDCSSLASLICSISYQFEASFWALNLAFKQLNPRLFYANLCVSLFISSSLICTIQ